MFEVINNRRGFTLVEILVALSILSIIIFSFAPLISSSFSNIYTAGRKSDALYQAQEQMENKLVEEITEDKELTELTITFQEISEEITVNGTEEQFTYTYDGHSGILTAFIAKKSF